MIYTNNDSSVYKLLSFSLHSWSKSSQNIESVSATGVFWLNIRNTIRVTPKSLNLKQNHMVHLITYPSSQDINLQSDSEQQQKQIDDISCSLTIPIVNPSKSTVNDIHTLCLSLFVGQNVEFSLTISVNLRGRIDPPTERVREYCLFLTNQHL